MSMNKIKILTCLFLVLILMLNTVAIQAAPHPQSTDSYSNCTDISEDALRGALNEAAQQIVTNNQPQVDVNAIVQRQWIAQNVDGVMDREVDDAVEKLKNETGLWDKFFSGWSPAKAEELTEQVAAIAFESVAFRTSIDDLANGIADEITAEIAALSAQSVSVTLACLQTFLEENYAASVVTTFGQQIQQSTGSIELTDVDGDAGIMSVIQLHQKTLGGIGVIIAAQITKRIVQKIGRSIARRAGGQIAGRVLGKAGSTIIPVVGWVVGTGLIVYDLYESRDGALPNIQESLKGEEVKSSIRDEIAATITPELRRELPQLAREIANELYNEWREFNRKYRQALNLAQESPPFKAILNQVDDLSSLAELVDIALPLLGRSTFDAAVNDGTLAQVAQLPRSALEILKHTDSLYTVVAWADVAQDKLDAVVNLEVYKHKAPTDFDLPTLNRLLALGDPAIVSKLSLLDNEMTATLLAISTSTLQQLAGLFSADDLSWIARYVQVLDQEQINRLITRLIEEPAAMDLLRNQQAWDALSGSGDIDDAITFLSGANDVPTLVLDAVKRIMGFSDVPLSLFWAKYSPQSLAGVGIGILAGLLLFLWLIYRALFARPKVVIHMPPQK